MSQVKSIRRIAFMLLAVIPLSLIGYYFAVYNEALFFLFEWFLTFLIVGTMILSFFQAIKIKTNLRWVPISILAFLVQFAILSLFLGPFTQYIFFFLFYFVSLIAFIIYTLAIRTVDKFKYLPVTFTIVSALFLLYIVMLHLLWGDNLS